MKKNYLYRAEPFFIVTKQKNISFPNDEIENIKKRLNLNYVVVTHRIMEEYGKYIENNVYYNKKLKFIKIIKVSNIKKLENSPLYKGMEKKWIDEIKKNLVNNKIEFIQFIKYDEKIIYNLVQLFPHIEYCLFNDNKSLAIIDGLKIKHFPIILNILNDKLIILEVTKNGIKDNFNKKTILYTVDNKLSIQDNDNWFNFKDHEYYFKTPVEINKKIVIENSYEYLKQKKTIFIEYEKFIEFIKKNIKITSSLNFLNNKIKTFYHGSPIKINDGFIKPNFDGFDNEPKLWVTTSRSIALLFAVKRFGTSIYWGNENNVIWCMETKKNAFDIFKKKKGYIYKINNNDNIIINVESNKMNNFVYTSTENLYYDDIEIIEDVWDEILKEKNLQFINYDVYENFLKKNF